MPTARPVDREHDEHHGHDHRHGRGHAHGATSAGSTTRAFALGTLINLAFTAVEAGYGLATGSLALLSDALHNLGDALGLALAWVAAHLALRPASARRTYGYRRATVLAPLANSLLLVGGAGALAGEALRRIGAPPAIDTLPVIVVATLAIGVNLGSALLFRHGHAHDLNQRGAYLHLLADAAVSLAVVLGALGIRAFGWFWLDPLLALGVAGVVAWSSWGLLRDSLDLALDAVPRGIDQEDVRRWLASQEGVAAVHHVHIWALGSRENALTAHLVRPAGNDDDAFLRHVADGLQQRFGIGHATVQLERGLGCAPCP
jgi:cobalt-zinc-cadmium efflux system protein